ncbi:hypothetical protein OXX79_010811 [Metschnikowia pulcherrima]
MTASKGGISFSAACGENPDKDLSGNEKSGKPRMGMMSMAVSNEYSDLEEDDDEAEDEIDGIDNSNAENGFFGTPPCLKNQSQAGFGSNRKIVKNEFSSNPEHNSMISQYGIGAKLLLGMGYKEGQGLGTRKNGISVPIETKLRPQGLGVGGIREKSTKRENDQSSDEEKPKTVAFSKPSYDLFAVIDDLERAGVPVPLHYKELSDGLSAGQTTSEVEQVYTKLSKVLTEVISIDEKAKALRLEIGHIETSLASDKTEQASLESLVNRLKVMGDNLGVTNTTSLLEDLVGEPYSMLPDIQSIFVSYAKAHVTSLFSSIDETAIDTLSQWAVLYRNSATQHVSTVLTPWDSMMLQLLKQAYSESKGETVSPAYNLRFWLDSPVIIDSPLVEQLAVGEIVIPTVKKFIALWDLSSGFDSRILEYLSEYEWDDSSRRHVVDIVADKYQAFFSQFWQDSASSENAWAHYEHEMKPVLEHFCQMGAILIAQYHEKRVDSLKQVMISKLVRFCQETPTDRLLDNLSMISDLQYSFGIVSSKQSEMLMSFTVLNPMIRHLRRLLEVEENPLPLFHTWQAQLASLSGKYPDMEALLLWYTNTAISDMRNFRNKRTFAVPLPSYNHDEDPESELESLFQSEGKDNHASTYAFAASDLIVTFKDVVQQLCVQNNAVFQSTLHRDANMNEIWEIKFMDGKTIQCFISGDVLWVREGSDFVPMDVTELLVSLN